MITVVTAFFDIGRGDWNGIKNGQMLPGFLPRSIDLYFERFARLAKMKNPMVIHTSPEFEERVWAARAGLEHMTEVRVYGDLMDAWREQLGFVQRVMDDPNFISTIKNPAMPEYWSAPYVLVNFLKSWFVRQSPIKTSHVAWIDFGYCRDDDRFPTKDFVWEAVFDDKINVFCVQQPNNQRSIQDIIQTGDVYIQGCHVVAPREKWDTLWQLMQSALDTLLTHNMIDDDQTLLLMSYFNSPADFHLHPGNPGDWFVLFKDARFKRPRGHNRYEDMIHVPAGTKVINVNRAMFGDLRNGDMIALLNVLSFLRRETKNYDLQFYLPESEIFQAVHCKEFLTFLKANTDSFSDEPGVDLSVPPINLWNFRGRIGDLFFINPDGYEQKKKIVICPLFDAPYNTWRNWPASLTQEIIDRFSTSEFDGYEKVLCAVSPVEGVFYRDFVLSTNFQDNLAHIIESEIFAGGDTGTSHFAGALLIGPKLYFYLEGEHSRLHTLPFGYFSCEELNMYTHEGTK